MALTCKQLQNFSRDELVAAFNRFERINDIWGMRQVVDELAVIRDQFSAGVYESLLVRADRAVR